MHTSFIENVKKYMKIRMEIPKMSPRAAKMNPKAPKGSQKESKGTPKAAKGTPKGAQREPKGATREPKGNQNGSKNRSRSDVRNKSQKTQQKLIIFMHFALKIDEQIDAERLMKT